MSESIRTPDTFLEMLWKQRLRNMESVWNLTYAHICYNKVSPVLMQRNKTYLSGKGKVNLSLC